MGRQERFNIIREIEKERKSKLLVYLSGDRRGLETRIASDVFPLFFRHLSRMGNQKSIDLFLYSTGGITMAGYGLVNLIRQFCKTFNVIVPFKAYSCATLITLGADNIIMTKLGQLSPIDPSIEHPLSPTVAVPGYPGVVRVPVSVEDAIGYLDLAKVQAGLKNEEALAKVFDRLSSAVNPLALGAVHRVREQIGFLAKMLLSYHVKNKREVDRIANILTRERFSHDYLIGRKEAKDVLKLKIVDVPESLNSNIVKLYEEYSNLLSLDTPYNPEVFLGSDETKTGNFDRAIMESNGLTHVFRTVKEVKRTQVTQPGIPTPVAGFQERILQETWIEDSNI